MTLQIVTSDTDQDSNLPAPSPFDALIGLPLDTITREITLRTLALYQGDRAKTAAALGIKNIALSLLLKKYEKIGYDVIKAPTQPASDRKDGWPKEQRDALVKLDALGVLSVQIKQIEGFETRSQAAIAQKITACRPPQTDAKRIKRSKSIITHELAAQICTIMGSETAADKLLAAEADKPRKSSVVRTTARRSEPKFMRQTTTTNPSPKMANARPGTSLGKSAGRIVIATPPVDAGDIQPNATAKPKVQSIDEWMAANRGTDELNPAVHAARRRQKYDAFAARLAGETKDFVTIQEMPPTVSPLDQLTAQGFVLVDTINAPKGIKSNPLQIFWREDGLLAAMKETASGAELNLYAQFINAHGKPVIRAANGTVTKFNFQCQALGLTKDIVAVLRLPITRLRGGLATINDQLANGDGNLISTKIIQRPRLSTTHTLIFDDASGEMPKSLRPFCQPGIKMGNRDYN